VGLALRPIPVGIAVGLTEVGNTVFTIVGVAVIPGIILLETGLLVGHIIILNVDIVGTRVG
jgi:hypothetical protein